MRAESTDHRLWIISRAVGGRLTIIGWCSGDELKVDTLETPRQQVDVKLAG